jgi:hypothetical protein
VIIELIGCPGSGKTTLVPAIVEAYGRRGIVARHVNDATRPYVRRTLPGRTMLRLVRPRALEPRVCWALYVAYRGVYAARAAAGNPRLVRHLWRTQRGRPVEARARERRVLYWYLRMMGAHAFMRRHMRADEAIVFDEGFAHRVVQLHTSDVESPRPRAIAAYSSVIPEPDVVFHVVAPPEVCVRRIAGRGVWSHFSSRDEAALDRFVDHAHRAVTSMADHMRRRGFTVIDVDNGDDDPGIASRGLDAQLGDAWPIAPVARRVRELSA